MPYAEKNLKEKDRERESDDRENCLKLENMVPVSLTINKTLKSFMI